jgi:signal transduction protein with GAF and PtsI domain
MTPRNIFITVIAALALAGIISVGRQSIHQGARDRQLAEAAITSMSGSPYWSGVRIEEAGDKRFHLALVYKLPPASSADVEADTKRVAKALLDARHMLRTSGSSDRSMCWRASWAFWR